MLQAWEEQVELEHPEEAAEGMVANDPQGSPFAAPHDDADPDPVLEVEEEGALHFPLR